MAIETIHATRVGDVSIRLVGRRSDFVIVLEEGALAAIDPRGSNRDHATRSWIRAVELVVADQTPVIKGNVRHVPVHES